MGSDSFKLILDTYTKLQLGIFTFVDREVRVWVVMEGLARSRNAHGEPQVSKFLSPGFLPLSIPLITNINASNKLSPPTITYPAPR